MSNETSPAKVRESVENAIEKSKEEIASMSNILDAFKDLLMERAAFKEQLSSDTDQAVPEVDPDRFRQGVPILGKENFRVCTDDLRNAADRFVPAMTRGFPAIEEKLVRMHEALQGDRLHGETLVSAMVKAQDDEIRKAAEEMEVDVPLIRFFLSQLVKPYAERFAASIVPLHEELQWLKGYCPICGSWPETSFIEGKEGRRWLRCSFCAHEWRYMRTACPFCENSDHEKLELIYSEDRDFERAELCHECKRYIVGIDLRDRTEDPVMEVIALRLFYLDILAQDRGFVPGAAHDLSLIASD